MFFSDRKYLGTVSSAEIASENELIVYREQFLGKLSIS